MDSPTTKRAKVEVRHIRAARVRLEQLYPTGYGAALALDVASVIAASEAEGYARATADAKAFLASKEHAAHQAQMREAEAALYDARLRIGCDEHVGASEKGRG